MDVWARDAAMEAPSSHLTVVEASKLGVEAVGGATNVIAGDSRRSVQGGVVRWRGCRFDRRLSTGRGPEGAGCRRMTGETADGNGVRIREGIEAEVRRRGERRSQLRSPEHTTDRNLGWSFAKTRRHCPRGYS
jgi:hypothetical protein